MKELCFALQPRTIDNNTSSQAFVEANSLAIYSLLERYAIPSSKNLAVYYCLFNFLNILLVNNFILREQLYWREQRFLKPMYVTYWTNSIVQNLQRSKESTLTFKGSACETKNNNFLVHIVMHSVFKMLCPWLIFLGTNYIQENVLNNTTVWPTTWNINSLYWPFQISILQRFYFNNFDTLYTDGLHVSVKIKQNNCLNKFSCKITKSHYQYKIYNQFIKLRPVPNGKLEVIVYWLLF